MHWSRKGALRTLRALRRHGGEASTYQIFEITHSLAVHTDIASLRVLLSEAMGFGPEDLVTTLERRTRDGKMIYSYKLSARAMFGGRGKQAALFSTGTQGHRERREKWRGRA